VDDIIVRSIAREYRVHTAAVDVAAHVRFFAARPDIAGPPLQPIDVPVEAVPEGFRLGLPGGDVIAASALEAANRLFHAIFTGLEEEAPGAALMHGASIVHQGRRIVLLGRKGAGKSTLTLYLLMRGFDVEGDEHVVVRERDVIARPRTLRLKEGTLALVPGLAEAVRRSPSMQDENGGFVYAVDPSVCGRPWRIAPGDIDALVVLAPNHGGGSALAPLPKDDAFQRLVSDCLMPERNRAAASARLFSLARQVAAYRLQLGDLGEAEACLRAVAGKSQ
jgi:hypothetical protein